MPDNKLTDNEIKRCKSCIHYVVCIFHETDCKAEKCGDYINKDLINRLQAIVEKCEKVEHFADETIKTLQAENDRLKPLEKFAKYNQSIRVEDMLVCASSLGEWLEFCDNLKAEAYKEALGIIDQFYNKHIFGNNDLEDEEKDAIINFSDDITYKLNNLLKEMVGDK